MEINGFSRVSGVMFIGVCRLKSELHFTRSPCVVSSSVDSMGMCVQAEKVSLSLERFFFFFFGPIFFSMIKQAIYVMKRDLGGGLKVSFLS